MKGLGAGFHQPVDGLHCLSEVSYISEHYSSVISVGHCLRISQYHVVLTYYNGAIVPIFPPSYNVWFTCRKSSVSW